MLQALGIVPNISCFAVADAALFLKGIAIDGSFKSLR